MSPFFLGDSIPCSSKLELSCRSPETFGSSDSAGQIEGAHQTLAELSLSKPQVKRLPDAHAEVPPLLQPRWRSLLKGLILLA